MEQARNEDLKPCRICVDFYGSASTNYLCSKCAHSETSHANEIARESQQQQPRLLEQVHNSPLAEATPSQEPVVEEQPLAAAICPEEEMKQEEPAQEAPLASAPTPSAQAAVVGAPAGQAAAPGQKKLVQDNKNKCWACNKKVGILKMECQCTFVFCTKHRHPESHNCTFDYFAANQQRIEQQNPHIKSDKMQKMF